MGALRVNINKVLHKMVDTGIISPSNVARTSVGGVTTKLMWKVT